MMFRVIFRVIASNFEENRFLADFCEKAWTNPLGFWSKFSNLLKLSIQVKEGEK